MIIDSNLSRKKELKYCIIIVPGLLGYAKEAHISSLKSFLKENGYQCITFTPSSLTTNSSQILVSYNQKQVYDELKNLVQRKGLDSSKLILVGHSAGGPVVLKYASQKDISAVITISSPSQVGKGDNLEENLSKWRQQGFLFFNSSLLGKIKLPYDYYLQSKDFNSLNYIHSVSCPKLFIAGEKDEIVGLESTRRVYNISKEPKQLMVIEGMEHNYKKSPEKVLQINQVILNFIESIV